MKNFLTLCCSLILSINVFAADATQQLATKQLATQQLATQQLATQQLATPKIATPIFTPQPPNLDAKSYILIDANSGKIIAEKNSDKKLPPASLTKLMTLYLTAQSLQNGQIHLDDKVRISKKAWKMGGSKMFVRVDTDVPIKELLQGIVVQSGNDATVAIAEYLGGTEDTFVQLMNQEAAKLGMTNTHYSDSSGMPTKDHLTTARDVSTLARTWINDFPQFYPWFKQKWYTYNKIKQPNRNRLLWRDKTVDGIKTGHTDRAGYCLVASAKRGDMRLISVVMDASTDSARASDSAALLNYGFHFYKSYKLYSAGQVIMKPRVWLGKHNYTGLGTADDFYVTVPNGQYKNINVTTTMTKDKLKAPLYKGHTYGKISVKLNDEEIASAPLIALKDNTRASAIGRGIDHVKMWFKK